MIYLYVITSILVVISFFFDREKTRKSFSVALKKFLKVAPVLFMMIIIISLLSPFITTDLISKLFNSNTSYVGVAIATVIGSVAAMPGFIAFPLCGMLASKGVSYMVLAAFTSSLMMIGVVTFPLEKKYLGAKVAIIKNLISFVVVILISLATGIFYGEIM